MNRKEKTAKSENRDPVACDVGSSPTSADVSATTSAGLTANEPFRPGVSDLDRYLDYTVVDREDHKVGSVDAVWEDHTGQPAYLAVRTGWLGLGKAHVVPAQSAEVSDATRKIRLPYSAEAIKSAPAFDDQTDIDESAEIRITEYYRTYGYTATSPDRPAPTGEIRETTREREEDVRIPLTKEEVKIGKREVEAGGVRLRKVIRTETVSKPVELQREEIVVERVPATDRPTTRADVAFREEEIYIPLRREEPVVEKMARTTEEVHVGKKRETERRDVAETVRREDVDIQRQGDAKRSENERPRNP